MGSKGYCERGDRHLGAFKRYTGTGFLWISDGKVEFFKEAGLFVDEIYEKLPKGKMKKAKALLGHTRWPSSETLGAHPFFDCKGEIAIMHNGNAKEISPPGSHKYETKVDSERIAHYLEKKLTKKVRQDLNKLLAAIQEFIEGRSDEFGNLALVVKGVPAVFLAVAPHKYHSTLRVWQRPGGIAFSTYKYAELFETMAEQQRWRKFNEKVNAVLRKAGFTPLGTVRDRTCLAITLDLQIVEPKGITSLA